MNGLGKGVPIPSSSRFSSDEYSELWSASFRSTNRSEDGEVCLRDLSPRFLLFPLYLFDRFSLMDSTDCNRNGDN